MGQVDSKIENIRWYTIFKISNYEHIQREHCKQEVLRDDRVIARGPVGNPELSQKKTLIKVQLKIPGLVTVDYESGLYTLIFTLTSNLYFNLNFVEESTT